MKWIDPIHDARIFVRALELLGKKSMSRGISGGKQVIKYTNTSNHYRVCSFSQNDAAILVVENTQFKFWQVLCHYCRCEVIYNRLTSSQQVTN